jgi:regulator of protease activity HflC (stomatin/prohibitin superfamily)
MLKFKGVALLVAVCLIAATSVGCSVVPSGSVGVRNTFGKISPTPVSPGVHMVIPGVNGISKMSVQTVAQPETFTALTKDSQKIEVTATARYSLKPEKAPEAAANIGSTRELVASVEVQPVLLSSVKDVISRYPMGFIIENQSTISSEITAAISGKLDSGYIDFHDFDVTGFVLDPEVQSSVEKKQIAIQELQRKETELATAKLEAQRLQELDKALTPSILQDKAIEKWNGQSAVVGGAGAGASVLIQPNQST